MRATRCGRRRIRSGSRERGHQLAVPFRDRGVAEEGEAAAARDGLGRRQQGPQVPDGEDRGNRHPPVVQRSEPPVAVHALGAPSREVGDGGALRKWDDVRILQGNQGVARPGGGPEPLAHVERAVGMGNTEAHGPIVFGFAPAQHRGQAAADRIGRA